MIELYQELHKTLRKHFKDYKDMGKKPKTHYEKKTSEYKILCIF